MSHKLLPASCGLLLIFSLNANAAETITLKAAVDEALHNSPSIQKAESRADEARSKRVEALSGFLPSLSGGMNYLLDKKYAAIDFTLPGTSSPITIPQIVPTTAFTLNANLPIFDGFANVNHFRSAEANESAAEKDLAWERFKLERKVTLQYYRILASKILLDVANQNLKTLEDHLRDANLLRKSGVSTNYDVLRVEVQVSEARSEALNAADNIEIANGSLAEILGTDRSFDVSGALPDLDVHVIDAVKSLTGPKRSDIDAMADRSRALDYAESSDHRYWVPHVGLFGQYQYYNNRTDGFSEWNQYRDAYMVGIGLTWNIFDGMTSISRARQTSDQFYQSERSLKEAQITASKDIDIWRRKFLYYNTVVKARQDDVQKSDENVRLTRAGRKVGARTDTDLLDTESDLFRSRAGSVNSHLGEIEALINLELATGVELYDFKALRGESK